MATDRFTSGESPSRTLRRLIVLEYVFSLACSSIVAVIVMMFLFGSHGLGDEHTLGAGGAFFFFVAGPMLMVLGGVFGWMTITAILAKRLERARGELHLLMVLAAKRDLESLFFETDDSAVPSDGLDRSEQRDGEVPTVETAAVWSRAEDKHNVFVSSQQV